MKTERLIPIALLVASASAADLVITSFDRNGALTWTNAVSNAVYQVQWAGSVTGPWTNFQSLAALDAIRATNHLTTVGVPMFYRVVADQESASRKGGLYRYTGYDPQGVLQIVGWWKVIPDTNRSLGYVIGQWEHGYAGECLAGRIGDQLGAGELAGLFEGDSVHVNLNRWSADDNVNLRGTGADGRYTGTWHWITFVGVPITNGTFLLEKVGTIGP